VRGSTWETRLDHVLQLVTELIYDATAPSSAAPARTRDELVGEGLRTAAPAELHLLDPDDPQQRQTLTEALRHADAEVRRVALATIAQSKDGEFAAAMLASAYLDRHRIVRRMAIDGAADIASDSVRALLESGLHDEDAWIRWKAIRGLREIGLGPSRDMVARLRNDEDFQVRFEAAAAAREPE
jgi:HEAT repeat protein